MDTVPKSCKPIMEIADLANTLINRIKSLNSCVVAFSGGVDSAVVANAAFLALGTNATAVTGVGPSLSDDERTNAIHVAKQIGMRHILLPTQEISDPDYLANQGQRCYHCKSELYHQLWQWAALNNHAAVLSGTNSDDLGDYRPGLKAASEQHIVAPLVDLNIDKETVRQLARYWCLSISEKPATPCLASRVAYGEAITEEKLAMIANAERMLSVRGFQDVRVRLHPGGLARIELHESDLERFSSSEIRDEICREIRNLGFTFVTLDLAGRQSGSLNQLLPLVQINFH